MDIKKVIIGNAVFFLAYILVTITQYIMTYLAPYLSATLEGIVWVGMILIWFVGLVVAPTGVIMHGLTQSEKEDPIFDVTIAVIYFIVSLAFTYFSYYMISTLVGVLTIDLLVGFFWMGIVLLWVDNIVVIPTYLIIKSKGG